MENEHELSMVLVHVEKSVIMCVSMRRQHNLRPVELLRIITGEQSARGTAIDGRPLAVWPPQETFA